MTSHAMHSAITPAALCTMIARQYPTLGATVPPAFAAALNRIDASLTDAAAYSAHDNSTDLAFRAAIGAAIAAGRDLATDKAVAAALHRKHLADEGVAGLAADQAEQARRGAIAEHLDELLAALRDPFATAAAAIDTARAALGPGLDLSSKDALGAVPAQHMSTWGAAFDGALLIDRIGKMWFMLATWTHAIPIGHVSERVLTCADLADHEVDAAGPGYAFGYAAVNGHPLELATLDTFRKRCARVQADRDAATERQAEYSRQYAAGKYR